MNTEGYEPKKIKEIYDKYAEFLKEKENLDWTEKQEIKRTAEKEIDQIEKLVPGVSSFIHPQKTQTDNEDIKKTIDYLFKVVREKGILIAVETAKRMHNPFVLDKFHDQLIEKGIIDKIKN